MERRVLAEVSSSALNSRVKAFPTEQKKKKKEAGSEALLKKLTSPPNSEYARGSQTPEVHSVKCSPSLKPSSTYTMFFPEGPMGIYLEPVTKNDIGAQVKGYHFPDGYSGINRQVVKDKVKEGDCIVNVDNVDVTHMSFEEVFKLLASKHDTTKIVTFSKHKSLCNPATPKNDKISQEITISSGNDYNEMSPVLASESSLRSLFPVRYEELTQMLHSVISAGGKLGANLEKGVLNMGNAFEDKTCQVLGNTVQNVPRFSQKDVNILESKMCAILQELSRTCILLGQSEEEVERLKSQMSSSKNSYRAENSQITGLRDSNNALTEKVESLLHDVAKKHADRDAWMSRARAAEEETESVWKELNELRDSNARYRDEIADLKLSLQSANSEVDDAIQLLANEQESMKEEMELLRKQSTEKRADILNNLQEVEAEKYQLEQERDRLAAQLDVLHDMSNSEKSSLDTERFRMKDAMRNQQKRHMQSLLEKEEALNRLTDDISHLEDELKSSQRSHDELLSENSGLRSSCHEKEEALNRLTNDISRLEDELKSSQRSHDELLSENSGLRSSCHEKEEALNRLADDMSRLEDELKSSQRSHDELLSENSGLRSSCHEKEEALNRLTDDISRLEDELKSSQRSHDELLSENSGLRSSCHEKEEALNRLADDISRLEDELKSSQRSHDSLQLQYSNLETNSREISIQLDSAKKLHSSLEELKQKNFDLNIEHTGMKRELEFYKEKFESASAQQTSEKSSFERRERELSDALTSAEDDIFTLKHDLKQLKNSYDTEVDKLRQENDCLGSEIETLKTKLSDACNEHHSSEVIYSQQTSHLHSEIARLSNDVERLRATVHQKDGRIEELETRQDALIQEENDLKASIANKYEPSISDLKKKLESVREEHSATRTILTETTSRLDHIRQEYSLSKQRISEEQSKSEELESKLRMEQKLYDDYKKKLAEEYESNISMLKSDMQAETDENLSFEKNNLKNEIKRMQKEKHDQEVALKNQIKGKEVYILDLKSKLDLLEASSRSSSRLQCEQINRLRSRAEVREKELLDVIQKLSADGKDNNDEESKQASSSAMVQDLQAEVNELRREIFDTKAGHLHEIEKKDVRFSEQQSKITELESCLTQLKESLNAEARQGKDNECALNEERMNSARITADLEEKLARAEKEKEIIVKEMQEQMNSLSENNKTLKEHLSSKQASDDERNQMYLEQLEKIKCEQNEEASQHKKLVDQTKSMAVSLVKETEARQEASFAMQGEKIEAMNHRLVDSNSRLDRLAQKLVNFKDRKASELESRKFNEAKLKDQCTALRCELMSIKETFDASSKEINGLVSSCQKECIDCNAEVVTTLRMKCETLMITVSEQQKVIEAATAQQKSASQNRADLKAIIEDWRSKASEAMHTVLHMQKVEASLRSALQDKRDELGQLDERIQKKDSEIVQLWELVDRLADEVKQATNNNELIVRSIDSWNSVHDTPNKFILKSEGCAVSLRDSAERKEKMYSEVASLFPTSHEHRSEKYRNINVPGLLMESTSTTASALLYDNEGKKDDTAADYTCEPAEGENVVSEYSHFRREENSAQSDESNSLDEEGDYIEYYTEFNEYCDEEGDVSAHVIGMHEYGLDETADWYLSSDTE